MKINWDNLIELVLKNTCQLRRTYFTIYLLRTFTMIMDMKRKSKLTRLSLTYHFFSSFIVIVLTHAYTRSLLHIIERERKKRDKICDITLFNSNMINLIRMIPIGWENEWFSLRTHWSRTFTETNYKEENDWKLTVNSTTKMKVLNVKILLLWKEESININ